MSLFAREGCKKENVLSETLRGGDGSDRRPDGSQSTERIWSRRPATGLANAGSPGGAAQIGNREVVAYHQSSVRQDRLTGHPEEILFIQAEKIK
jgi:hypothetical protein